MNAIARSVALAMLRHDWMPLGFTAGPTWHGMRVWASANDEGAQ